MGKKKESQRRKVFCFLSDVLKVTRPHLWAYTFLQKTCFTKETKNNIKHLEGFFKVFLSFCTIKNPDKILNISTDKPDNHFLSISFEEDAFFITGDNLALEFAKTNNIKAASPSDFIKNR